MKRRASLGNPPQIETSTILRRTRGNPGEKMPRTTLKYERGFYLGNVRPNSCVLGSHASRLLSVTRSIYWHAALTFQPILSVPSVCPVFHFDGRDKASDELNVKHVTQLGLAAFAAFSRGAAEVMLPSGGAIRDFSSFLLHTGQPRVE